MDEEEQNFFSEDICWKAIENADGVPYILIFGSRPGEGYYPRIGEGIGQLLGVASKKITERVFLDMVETVLPMSADIPMDITELREKFIAGDLKTFKADVLINIGGGEKKWLRDTSLPIYDENTGKVNGAFGILMDINEQKSILNALQTLNANEIQTEFLKSAFLRNISHEIRTPLNAIVGFTTLFNEQDNTADERLEIMGILYRNADHLLEIITNIIEISNIEAGTIRVKKSLLNVHSLFQRIYDRFRVKAFAKSIELRLSETEDGRNLSILTDGFKLFQIIAYLVDNALKFTESGTVEIGYTMDDKNIQFYVADSGIGIRDVDQVRLFTRFYQKESGSTRRFDGTGLGLSISKAYVELLEGDIWFTSKEGKGSTFYFTIPNRREEG